MNLPNKLTLGRILVIPVFILFLAYNFFDNANISRIIAASLFVAASVTDFFDGWIARKHNLITDFGKFMDPLADKFLIIGAMLSICFSDYIFDYSAVGYEPIVPATVIRQIFFWAAVIVVFRELTVTSMRLVVVSSNGAVIAASWYGKCKTVAQMVSVGAVITEPILFPYTYGFFTSTALIIMIFFTLLSGIDYMKKYWKFINTNK
ncbi:MAG: CDP-alcohol phosphatidyltransferase family protein [Clostridia bacterium]|nr:CDP-alcohol phosphatidyltransferase family protein [Clostridia bacterium]